jgi:REP element-mobilizing transposase RayT
MPTLPHSHQLRKGRASVPGQAYLVTAVTHARTPWFTRFEHGCMAARTLTQPACWPDASLTAWVLMPDHMHLLVSVGDREPLSLAIQRVKGLLSTALRTRLGDQRIWQPGFHDHALRREESLRDAARYIIANPLRAGLVAEVGQYPFWSAAWLEPGCDPLDP